MSEVSDSDPSKEAKEDGDESGAAAPASTSEAKRLSTPPAKFVRTATYTFLIANTLVNLVADLASKWWAKSTLEHARTPEGRKVEVIPDVMNFIFAKNKGGAWGLLQGETEALRRPFFLIVSVAAIVFIVSLYRKLTPEQRALKWGLPLVLGGALGNLVDRVRYGYVVDFIDIYAELPQWVSKIGLNPGLRHWPTFNVADVSICVGVGLMAIDMFTSRGSEDDKEAESSRTVALGSGEPDTASAKGGEGDDEPAPATLHSPSGAPPAPDAGLARTAILEDVTQLGGIESPEGAGAGSSDDASPSTETVALNDRDGG